MRIGCQLMNDPPRQLYFSTTKWRLATSDSSFSSLKICVTPHMANTTTTDPVWRAARPHNATWHREGKLTNEVFNVHSISNVLLSCYANISPNFDLHLPLPRWSIQPSWLWRGSFTTSTRRATSPSEMPTRCTSGRPYDYSEKVTLFVATNSSAHKNICSL